MIYQYLNYGNIYQITDSKCDNRVMKKVCELTEKFDSQLVKKEMLFLTIFSFLMGNFYGLPKVHKIKQIKEAILQQNKEYIELYEPNDLTVRPIVGGPNCPAKPLSELINKILKPLLIHIRSYVR